MDRKAMQRLLRAALVTGALVATGALACEDDAPRACQFDRSCYGRGHALCQRVAHEFCAEPGRKCQGVSTLTMDPRQCVALIRRIHVAQRADVVVAGRHPEKPMTP